jgi:Asp-tRNA(Asn)/Glu-tRNA(Gln) amidotransferase B subunit
VDLPMTRDFDDQTLATFINLTTQNGWTKETQIKVAQLVGDGTTIEEAAGQFGQVEGLADIVNTVIQENAAVVESYRAGKEQAFNFLVGQVMAKAQGRANINTVREELQKALL